MVNLDRAPSWWFHSESLDITRRPQQESAKAQRLWHQVCGQPSLAVEVDQKVVYLRPQEREDEPSEDPEVTGMVTLYVPRTGRITDLRVRLTAKAKVAWSGSSRGTESGDVLEREVKLETAPGGEVLQKGHHRFSFLLSFSSSSPTLQWCPYGAVYYIVSASCSWSANGIKRPLTSSPVQLYPFVNPGSPESFNPPSPLTATLTKSLPGVCNVNATLVSPVFMIGGLIHLNLEFSDIETAFEVYTVRLRCIERYEVQSLREPGVIINEHTKPMVFMCDASHKPNGGRTFDTSERQKSLAPAAEPIIHLTPTSKTRTISHAARLPRHNWLHDSTHPGTRTPLRIRHTLVLEVQYRVPPPGETRTPREMAPYELIEQKQRIKLSTPVDLCSCWCLLPQLTLPKYSAPIPIRRRSSSTSSTSSSSSGGSLAAEIPPCICTLSLDRLIAEGYRGAPGSGRPELRARSFSDGRVKQVTSVS